MAVDPITAGAVVSGLVKLIVDKLGSPVFTEIRRSLGVKADLQRLSHTLDAINDVLLDAEEQQTTLRSVQDWLLDLKDVTHDIEDVLDLISTQALENRAQRTTLARWARRLFPPFSLAWKLKVICGRLEEISANRRDFNLQERHMPAPPPLHSNGEGDECPFIQESSTFGRKEDRDWIVARLFQDPPLHEVKEISVLSIVGIGGIGKTTLAKLVFNDPGVGNFEVKLWASMPNKFSKKTAIEKIFECATGENSSGSNMQAMVKRLYTILAGQTYILVLDNVWASGPSILADQTFLKEWLDLKEFLEVGSKSSKIIVTTREDRVVSIVGTMEAYKLKPLSNEDCRSIFVKYAFRDGKEKQCPSLSSIGEEIVRKCCGVPLAARTLGSQLSNVRDESYWRMVEESKFWKIEQAHDDILPALKLSFDKLPYVLKACFSFCSTRTTNDSFKREHMVFCWMALGLIESTEMNGTQEEIGIRYFNELVSRSFFEVIDAAQFAQRKQTVFENIDPSFLSKFADTLDSSKIWGLFQMHDLVHELGRYVTGEETAFVNFNIHEVSSRVKHLVWTEDNCLKGQFPCQLLSAKKARSLRFESKKGGHMSTTFLHSIVSKFRCLRILSLADFEFEDLPNSIGDLKHLRYLNLAGNGKLKRLPNSISKLVNLQTLSIARCTRLELFPRNLNRLISLRHFYFTSKLDTFIDTCYHGWTSILKIQIFDCANLTSLSEKIGTLTTLRVLQICNCPKLASLPNSVQLLIALEQLEIQMCEKLNLSGWEGLNGLRNLGVLITWQLPLLVQFPDGLQHCTSLSKLIIKDCNLSTLPRGIQALKSLQLLLISRCPLLGPRCQRATGEDWDLISHIPIIQVY